jgi:hypothetical protein
MIFRSAASDALVVSVSISSSRKAATVRPCPIARTASRDPSFKVSKRYLNIEARNRIILAALAFGRGASNPASVRHCIISITSSKQFAKVGWAVNIRSLCVLTKSGATSSNWGVKC